jgi:L-fucose mutarotase/ribose pyranase (RbsD/FucU family)
VLTSIHPLLTGKLLAHLDATGHSDAVVLADAHFPAANVAAEAYLIVRTDETRIYGNVILRMGVVTAELR